MREWKKGKKERREKEEGEEEREKEEGKERSEKESGENNRTHELKFLVKKPLIVRQK